MNRSARPAAAESHPGADERIRLLHVVDLLTVAGMEYGVIKLLNHLDPRRYDSMICCQSHQVDATRSLLGAHVRVFEMHRRPGFDGGLVLHMASLFRREHVQIVHSHNWPTFLYSCLATSLAGTPVFLHGEHGHEDPGAPVRRLGVKRILARRPARLTTVSAGLSEELRTLWRVPADRVQTVANGVDLARFGAEGARESIRRELGLDPDTLVVTSVGMVRPVKDHPTLLRAFALSHRDHPAARLLLVGKGDWDPIRELARGLGIESAVVVAGERRDIPEILAGSDVYVNSSTTEGMSNTILEAMAAGRPVVATAVGGNPELVEEGVTGFLVPAGNPEVIGAAISRLLSDGDLRQRMGQAGRNRVELRHSLERMARDYDSLYRAEMAHVGLPVPPDGPTLA
jgi:sugar transferase (PEP-CTERM/EpsH1 system associated)